MSFARSGEIDASWQYISQGVDVLMKRDLAHLGLTTEVYMNMYTAIHNFCVSTQPDSGRQYAPVSGRGHLTKLLGGELYARLVEYLKQHLEQLLREAPRQSAAASREAWEDQVLSYYNRSWTRYLTGARYLDHIFSYLNRHWVKQERDEGGRKRGIYEVHALCLVLWRDCMLAPLETVVVPVLLAEIKRDRDGKHVDSASLQTCVQSLVAVGFDDLSVKRTNLLFYTEHFQQPFLLDTKNYYARESQHLLATAGVQTYMRRVGERLDQERQRVLRYLHPSTEEVLMAECEQVLIEAHVLQIQNEFLGLLKQNDRELLHVLFALLHKTPNGLDPVQKHLEAYVERTGMQQISSKGEELKADPKLYVATLLHVKQHFDSLLTSAFDSWPPMKTAIDCGFARVVNNNLVAKPSAEVDSRTPELLSRYADSLLKRSARHVATDSNIAAPNTGIESVLQLLQYTEEKDVFERHYQRMLSRRLVLQASANDELEQRMVKRLGDICGFEYTNKLQRMFSDITSSANLRKHFAESSSASSTASTAASSTAASSTALDSSEMAARRAFAPLVLAKGFWPLPFRDVPDFRLPYPLNTAFDEFAKFYDQAHSGRKLRWLWNFGKGEMKLNLPNGRAVLLLVSIYQMMILLAFNDADELSHEQLKADVGLPAELLDGSLAYIVKSGILVASNGRLRFNGAFYSKRQRINLNLPLKTEARPETGENDKQLEEQRQGFLQAVVVRIMKARKQLGHAQLVEEIMQQALARFRPSVKDVKRALTTLLEREYLKRIGTDEYEYIA